MLTVYSKNNCPFCDKTKYLLELKGIAYQEISIDQDTAAKEFIISQGHRTVPQIYLNGKLFVTGGYSGLVKLEESKFVELK